MNEDWSTNQAVVAMVNAILLGFIRAHGAPGKEAARLGSAKKALFGIKPPRGRPEDPDTPELLYMANQYALDRGAPTGLDGYTPIWSGIDPVDARSVTELARAALEKKIANDSRHRRQSEEKVRNLVNKFDQQRDGLLRIVIHWGEHAFDDDMSERLADVKRLLDVLGIPFAPAIEPTRDGNLVI